jgi:hypothetical protein
VGPRICRPPATSVKDSSTSWSRDWNNVIVSDLESPVYLCTLISDLHRPISATHVYSVHGWHVSHCRIERLRYRDTTLEPWNTLEMSPLFVISEIAPKKAQCTKNVGPTQLKSVPVIGRQQGQQGQRPDSAEDTGMPGSTASTEVRLGWFSLSATTTDASLSQLTRLSPFSLPLSHSSTNNRELSILVWSSASLVEGTAPPTLPPTHAPDVTRADGGECRPRAPTGNKLANV